MGKYLKIAPLLRNQICARNLGNFVAIDSFEDSHKIGRALLFLRDFGGGFNCNLFQRFSSTMFVWTLHEAFVFLAPMGSILGWQKFPLQMSFCD
ncbi:MAG TPA: hypothetical protein VG028_10115 [Terriglobia bacterium]|nr:hypothetical protein [Terriglobia bacterium]